MSNIQVYKPNFNVLYGVTHDQQGNAIVRAPRSVKVSIGKPKGRAIHAYVDPRNGKLAVVVNKAVTHFDSVPEAKAFYRANREKADERKYPEKLPYFTFSKIGPDGNLEPDLETIMRHGPTPIEIDIMFVDDHPLHQAFEFWAASGLRCRGNGLDAERSVEMPAGFEEIAADCKKDGERTFPLKDACWTRGCPYAKPLVKNGKEYRQCAVHSRLSFQLISDIRLGARAVYDTTGMRSSSQLFSCLTELRTFTGGGDNARGYVRGIPLRFCLRPFTTNHNGQPGKAYSVSLEFRAESLPKIREKLLEFQSYFQVSAPALPEAQATRQITAGEPITAEELEPETDIVDATVMNQEFDTLDDDGDDDGEPPPEAAGGVRSLKDRLAAPATEPSPQPEATQPGPGQPAPVFVTPAKIRALVASYDGPEPTGETVAKLIADAGMTTKEPDAAFASFLKEWQKRQVTQTDAPKQTAAFGDF